MTAFTITFLLGIFMLSTIASGQIIVAKDGSGQFKTINEALKIAIKSGDDIIVKAGEYSETIVIEDGKEFNIEAEGDVLIKGKTGESVISLVNCYELNFKGFRFKGLVTLTKCSETTLSGCLFNGDGAISIVGSNNVHLYGNTFTQCTTSLISIDNSQQVDIVSNVMYGNTANEAIHMTDVYRPNIKNNTIAYNKLIPVFIGDECDGASVKNNIIAFNTITTGWAVVTASASAKGSKAQFNDVYQNKNQKGVASPYQGMKSENDLVVDPLFVDGASGKLAIKDSSPCWGAGEDGFTRFGAIISGINLGADIITRGNPINFEEQYDEGIVFNKRLKYSQAKEIFNRLLKTYPRNADLLIAIGNSYQGLNQFKEAMAAYQKCLTIRPKDSFACFNIACTFSIQGNTTDGLVWLEKAIQFGIPQHILENDEGIEELRKTTGYKKLVKDFDPDK